jgi:hypothetical protein
MTMQIFIFIAAIEDHDGEIVLQKFQQLVVSVRIKWQNESNRKHTVSAVILENWGIAEVR